MQEKFQRSWICCWGTVLSYIFQNPNYSSFYFQFFIGATVLYSPFYFHWLSIFHLTMTTPHLLLIFHLTMTTLNNKQFLYVLVKQVLDSTENFCLLTSIILQKRARKTPIENFFQPRAWNLLFHLRN